MSADYMLLRDLNGDGPIGPIAEVLRRARRLGVNLEGQYVKVSGVELEIALDVRAGKVLCVHVSPHGPGDAEAAMRKLADAIGAVVFDSQTGRGLGEPEPSLPDAATDYELHLVSIDMTVLGDATDIWHRLARSIGASREQPTAQGEGWTATARVVADKNSIARYVTLRAAWSNASAREELFERLIEASEENGWVPFDAVRNDTIKP